MAYSRRIPGLKFDRHDREDYRPSSPLAQYGLTELKASINILQQRLKNLNRASLKTGSMSQETMSLIQSLETALHLCQSTYKMIDASNRRVVSVDDDTRYQIHKAFDVLSRYFS